MFSSRDRAGQLHRAAVQQKLFRQRRFAGVRMRNDGECSPPLNFFGDVHKDAEVSTTCLEDKRVVVPASLRVGASCSGNACGGLSQNRFVCLKILFERGFARKRNRRAFGVPFEMFVMHQRLADESDMKVRAFQFPDLTGL